MQTCTRVACGYSSEYPHHFGRHLSRCPSSLDDLLRLVQAEPRGDCLIPASSKGRAKVRGDRAHRVALEIRLGRKLLPGLVACHTCDVDNCVNPDHLWEGTQEDNLKDMRDKSRASTATYFGGERDPSPTTRFGNPEWAHNARHSKMGG